eukprot:2964571-Lingulodinium_polyedra.AAC.1
MALALVASVRTRRLATACGARGLASQRTLQLTESVAAQLHRCATARRRLPEVTPRGRAPHTAPRGNAG